MDDIIKESDLIQLDGTIDKLISQLSSLNTAYGEAVAAIKVGAESISSSLKAASGATREGRRAIDEAAAAADRYQRAQYELSFALSETGHAVAILKDKTREVNRATIDQHRQLEAAAGSYDKIKSEVKELTALYKSLSEEERKEAEFGEQIIAELQAKNAELKELDRAIKPVVEQMSRLQKAEKELAYWQSEEGQRLLEVKQKIKEVTSARKEEKAVLTPLEKAQEKYNKALNEETQKIRELTFQTKQINTQKDLEAKVASTTAGSYNRLSAEYELTKFKIKNMSDATEEGRKEIEETQKALRGMYAQMRQFQEATGVYSLGVGDYAQSWSGLGYSVQQVVRELPSATVSLNTFFLAISNNIPILIDEINRARIANKALQAQGKETVPVTKQITKALFSWQTALVVVLTVLAAYGKEILQFISNTFKGKTAALELSKAMKNIAEEIGNTNDNYGENMLAFRKLQDEWKNLKTEAEKTKWIEDNKDAFKQLNIAIYDSSDAENLLVTNTESVKRAFKERAKAAATYKITQDKYEELLKAEEELRLLRANPPENPDEIRYVTSSGAAGPIMTTPGTAGEEYDYKVRNQQEIIANLQAEIDLYYELGNAATTAADAEVDRYSKTDGATKHLRDLTDYINNMNLRTTEKYEKAVTDLERDEYEERRKEAHKAYTTSTLELQNMYDKNERIIKNESGKYKGLTDEQLATVKTAQSRILATITNLKNNYTKTLSEINLDETIGNLEIVNEGVQLRIDATKKGSEEEFNLRKQQLHNEMQLAKLKNEKLLPEERQSEIDIINYYNKLIGELMVDHQLSLYEIQEEGIQLRLKGVKEGSEEELNLQLQLIEKQRAIALMQNKLLPENQRMPEADINAGFDKQATTVTVNYAMSGFDQQQALAAAKFNTVEHTEREITKFTLTQEKQRWEAQLALAKAGLLDWSEAQLKTAEATVAGIDKKLGDISGFKGFIAQVGDKGLGGGLLEALGFDNDAISAFNDAVDTVIENLNEILQAEIDLAEAAVTASEQRVDAARSAYDAEIEARNNGYANNVEVARRELEEERKSQAEKQKIFEEATRRQERLNTITQTSSLITAAAQIWSTMSGLGIIGPALAAAAIATMFGSFVYAKVKASQVTSQEYGEGGLEFLEGGSHASGNDIDLGINNKRNRRMHAEGGEALAIINRRNTKRYRKVLPDVIESLNNGTFQDKYLNAFASSAGYSVLVDRHNPVDLSRIENDVQSIRKQNETKIYVMPDGTIVTQYKNVRRVIRKS